MRTLSTLAAVLLSADAFALSCEWGVTGASVEEGQTLPANAEIFVQHTFAADVDVELALLDADGEPVVADLLVAHNSAVLRPLEPLQVGSTYTLTDTSMDGWFTVGFVAGEPVALDAPAAPRILDTDTEVDFTEWGTIRGASVELSEVDGAARYVYQIAEQADFSDAWELSTVNPNVFLGQGLCSDTFPAFERRQRYHIRAAAVGVDGQRSPWATEGRAVRSCSTGGAPGPVLLAFPALMALGLRRRR